MKKALIAMTLAGMTGWQANATIINFNDLASGTTVPSWYAEWAWSDTWSNPWEVSSGQVYNEQGPAYLQRGEKWWHLAHNALGLVNVQGASFSGAAGVTLQVEAWNTTVGLIATKTLTLTSSLTWYDLGFQNVDFLKLYPSSTQNMAFSMDDFTYSAVPEPSTYIAGALLLLPFGASTLRMLRKNRKA